MRSNTAAARTVMLASIAATHLLARAFAAGGLALVRAIKTCRETR